MKKMVREMSRASDFAQNSRNIVMDIVSSVSADGRIVNTVTHSQAERRDITVITPYGIASSALDDMMVQVIVSDANGRMAMVGVNDPDKPDVGPGETILYSKFGCTISMKSDGNIELKSQSGKSVTVDQLYDYIHR